MALLRLCHRRVAITPIPPQAWKPQYAEEEAKKKEKKKKKKKKKDKPIKEKNMGKTKKG